MSDNRCSHLNARGRWCRASVPEGHETCRYHVDGSVRDWPSDQYRVADAVEHELAMSVVVDR